MALGLSASTLGGARYAYADGEGPLGPLSAGSVSLEAPQAGSDHWTATFGAMLLCRRGDSPVTLQRIRPTWAGAAVPTDIVIRSVTVTDAAAGTQDARNTPLPTGSLRGDAKRLPGIFARPEGFTIRQRCDPGTRDFSEILVTMHAGVAGASIRSLIVDYLAGGRLARTVVPIRLTACGAGVDDPEMCPSSARM